MTKETKQSPIDTLRDGALHASIWKNQGENGTFFSVTFGRTFTDNKTEEVRDADSFSGAQLLKLARLAEKAYDQVGKLAKAQRILDEDNDKEEAA